MTNSLVTNIKAGTRLLRGVAHLFQGMWTITRHFPKATQQKKSEHIARWARGLLLILRIQLHTIGAAQTTGPLLVVSNHISWLDILVLLAVQPVRFVSKSEIKHWPIIGWLATNVGTLYIERESRRDALRVVHHIAEALRGQDPVYGAEGSIIAVFPEGTTSDGSIVLPFHANLIQAAISAHAPVQPVALRFEDAASGERSFAASYIDDDTLFTSVWRLMCAQPLRTVVNFGEPETSGGRDRRAWAVQLKDTVTQAL